MKETVREETQRQRGLEMDWEYREQDEEPIKGTKILIRETELPLLGIQITVDPQQPDPRQFCSIKEGETIDEFYKRITELIKNETK